MALSARNREKSRAKSQELLPGSQVLAYAVGRRGSNPVVVGLTIAGVFVLVSAAISALTGTLFIIGVLPFLIVQHLASPPAAVAVADQGVALLRRSVWTGRPSAVLAAVGFDAVYPETVDGGRVKVVVGTEAIWMTRREEAHLRAGMTHIRSFVRAA